MAGRGQPKKSAEEHAQKITVCISPKQNAFIRTHYLRSSWLLQDKINELMDSDIHESLDSLLQAGYLSLKEYKNKLEQYKKERYKEHTETTVKDIKNEIKNIKRLRKKLDDELEYREILLGDKKPTSKVTSLPKE